MTSLRPDRCQAGIADSRPISCRGREQVIAPMIDVEEDIAMLFGDDDFSDDDSDCTPPPSTYEVGGPSTAAAEGQSFSLQHLDFLCLHNIAIGEIGPRVSAVEGQVHVMAFQMVQVVGRLEQVGTQVEQGQQAATQRDEVIFRLSQQVQTLHAAVQQRDVQIQQLQAMVSEMSSRESTLMQCILRMDKRLADLERRPPGPQ
ncbi:hypothetical protein Tco_0763429 [Tanacetum coccineum]